MSICICTMMKWWPCGSFRLSIGNMDIMQCSVPRRGLLLLHVSCCIIYLH
jgi:hypothetical protein